MISGDAIHKGLQIIADIDDVYIASFNQKVLTSYPADVAYNMSRDVKSWLGDPQQRWAVVKCHEPAPDTGPYVYDPDVSFPHENDHGTLFYPFKICKDINDTVAVFVQYWLLPRSNMCVLRIPLDFPNTNNTQNVEIHLSRYQSSQGDLYTLTCIFSIPESWREGSIWDTIFGPRQLSYCQYKNVALP